MRTSQFNSGGRNFYLLLVAGTMLVRSAFAEELEFRPRTVIDHAFKSIVEPPTESVAVAEKANTVRGEELVLGVVVNGEARAYPINTLTGPRREIINDELGGRSIAATW